MTTLLDANVLVALAVADPIFHPRARAHLMVKGAVRPFATCAVTQAAFLRVLMGAPHLVAPAQAFEILERIAAAAGHTFWSDGFSYLKVPREPLRGPRQLTDAWLAELARRKGAKLATFDKGLALAHPDVADLIP